jgi:hypothetical protein
MTSPIYDDSDAAAGQMTTTTGPLYEDYVDEYDDVSTDDVITMLPAPVSDAEDRLLLDAAAAVGDVKTAAVSAVDQLVADRTIYNTASAVSFSPSVTSIAAPPRNPLSIGYVTAVFVLALVCLVLGLVYGYIHYTRLNNRWSRGRLFGGGSIMGGAGGKGSDAHGPRSTHIFLIRSSSAPSGGNPKSIQSL